MYVHTTYTLPWLSRSQSYVTTDGQSASLSWYKVPVWGLRSDLYFCQTVAGLLMWGQSRSHTAIDGQPISKSWCRTPSGAHDQIFTTLWQLRSCFCWALSLTRGQVCLLYILLALASIVFLGSESFLTRDHILLSQILDFPFRRLLRLAGSRWRYSNPPPNGVSLSLM
jgi:hypothetical protein